MAKRRRPAVSPVVIAAGAAVAVAGLAFGIALAGGHLSRSPQRPVPIPPQASSGRIRPAQVPARPAPPPAVQPDVRRQQPSPEPLAQVAIIFDDAGGSLDDLEEIIALGRPVTVAVLPGLRYSMEVSQRARAAGLEVFLHLPIEPEDPSHDLGPGGIRVSMPDEEIEQRVRDGLASVPGAVGVNNHMGSKGTADERVMRAVLRVVQERHLLFVDSVTSPRSIAGALASEMRIPSASRQVFLDNDDDPAKIRAQMRRLIAIARRKGRAVAIGHAHRMTAQVLRGMLREFDTAGVVLVPASRLTR